MKKNAKEWLNDLNLAWRFGEVLKGYDIYDGELEELTNGFWFAQITDMNMAGLEPNEIKAVEAFVTSPNKAMATVKAGYSRAWFEILMTRALSKIDTMLEVTDKYDCFKRDQPL